MESKIEDTSENIGKFKNGKTPGEGGRNEIQIQDLATSESKTPLKTPVKDGNEDVQVKFAGNDSMNMSDVNGDAKIDIDHVKTYFSGMSKEELLKYANDPFWIRMRMILFIFFWIVWIAMFVGAIAIIIVAPKCEPPKWYNQGPLYEVDVEKFVKSSAGDHLNKLVAKIPYLDDLHVKGLILSSILKKDDAMGDAENVIDFTAIDDKLGSLEDFKKIIDEINSKGMHLIISLVPNHSSDKHMWFNKSIAKEKPYDNYYIWAPSPGTDSQGTRLPPNNWLSVTGGSAWEWNDERQEFFLHQFDVSQPDLNFRNPDVMKEFNKTIKFWLDQGVTGFSLDKIQYLLEDQSLQDEEINTRKAGAVHTDYDFYYHSKTYSLPGNDGILAQWKQLIHDSTKEAGVLMIRGDPPIPSDSSDEGQQPSVDLIRNDKLVADLPVNFKVSDLYPKLEKLVQHPDKWPLFQLEAENLRLADRFSQDDVDGLHIITLLVKGTPITYFGEELGIRSSSYFPWDNSTDSLSHQQEEKESHYKIYKALMTARESKAIIYGSTNLTTLNDSLIVLTRIKTGSPGYLAAYNLSPGNVTADFSVVEGIPEELMVYTTSMNSANKNLNVKDKIKSKSFLMSPRSAIVFTFVPQIEENN